MARRDRNGGQTHHHKASQVRCAVYTRKSTEEGLDQDFNSLDAQREACEAFIRSQKSEGWALVPEAYDDGGISGGTLERPALKRLMADIVAGRVDIVVVYKVDRLTRSLADFAKLVDTFDAARASFVSVTQAFNTSTSMGRLTLNMLLSFAQFEREVTAERIRDKIAASKKKGMWMGGPVPLGYDAIDRKLVVNAAEAETVRHTYGRYIALGSIKDLKAELDRDGIVSKRRASRAGVQIGGKPFSRGGLALILRNPLYVGEVQHKGERHPGQHAPVIDRDVWDAVREKLDQQRVERRNATNAAAPSPLAGLLFDHDGNTMSPSHSSKGPTRIRYRYYVSHRLVTGHAADHPDAWRLPAGPVERAVRTLLVDLLRDPATMSGCLLPAASAAEHGAATEALGDLATSVIDTGSASLRSSLIGLGARVVIAPDAITLSVSRLALAEKLGITADDADDVIARTRRFTLRKRGRETRIVIGDIDQPEPDAALIGLIANGTAWARMFFEGDAGSLHVLARQLGVERTLLNRAIPLAFLAPDITQAILEGRHPPGLTITMLKRLDPFPIRWPDQRRALGFAEPVRSSRT